MVKFDNVPNTKQSTDSPQ